MNTLQHATIREQKMFALIPKIPAFLSLISSACVLVSVSRDITKRKKMFHRIAVAMSVYGILQSFVFLIGTAAFPVDTPHAYGAAGNYSTCVAQGVMIQLTIAIPLYYVSLSIYSFLAIRADFKEERIVWVEKWIHGVIHIYTLPSALYMALTESLNPTGPVCWIASFPQDCGSDSGIACVRSSPKLVQTGYAILAAPFYLKYAICVSILSKMYIDQRRKESETAVNGKDRFLKRARRKKSRIIAIQASLFSFALFLGYILSFLARNMIWLTGKPNYLLWIAGSSLVALQSFLFTTVYFGLQIPRYSGIDDTAKSYCSLLRSRLADQKLAAPGEEQNDDNAPKVRSFSIFDGTQISSSPWNAFLIDDDEYYSTEDDGNGHDIEQVISNNEEGKLKVPSSKVNSQVSSLGESKYEEEPECSIK